MTLEWPDNLNPKLEYVFASTVGATATAGGTDTSLTFSTPRLVATATNIDVIYKRQTTTPQNRPTSQPTGIQQTIPRPTPGGPQTRPRATPLYSCVRTILATEWVHDTPIRVEGEDGAQGESGKPPQEFYKWSLLASPPQAPTYPSEADRVNDDFVPSGWTDFDSIPRIKPTSGSVVIWRTARSWNTGTSQWSDFTAPVVLGSTDVSDLRGEDGGQGAQGKDGRDGRDAAGVEHIFARTADSVTTIPSS